MDEEFSPIPKNAEVREFTGVWIPAQVFLDDRLKAVDRILYGEISSYGAKGCWKRSQELMKRCNVKERAFRESCKRLIEYGYITQVRKFGRMVRVITLGFPVCRDEQCQKGGEHQCQKGSEQQCQKGSDDTCQKGSVQLDNRKEKRKDNRIERDVSLSTPDKKGILFPTGVTSENIGLVSPKEISNDTPNGGERVGGKVKRSMKNSNRDILLRKETIVELSNQVGVSVGFAKGEIEKMVDWLKSKGKVYKDYKAFGRNWLRRAKQDNEGSRVVEKRALYY